MKQLRIIRIFLAIFFLAASIGAVCIGAKAHPVAAMAEKSQIILSALSITAGTTFVWLLLSILFGRVYCSTVCPIGTLSDLAMKCRRFLPRHARRPFRYRHPSRASIHILWIYLACLVIGIVGVPFLIEPWNIMRNLAAATNPDAVADTWLHIGFNAMVGFAGGLAAISLIAITAFINGREFCTVVCPLGTALGYVSNHAIFHIEIDHDKCSSCGLCEEICRSSCIKVVSRYVDNARCVRCLDCVVKCPDDAIHLQINRNRPATPLLTRVKKANK